MSDQISKVFWPRHCTKSRSGFVVGWNLRGFTVCVATIINENITLMELEEVLTKEFNTKNSQTISMLQACHGMPTVLGEWHSADRRDCSPGFINSKRELKQRRSQSAIWVHLVYDSTVNQPAVKEVSCYGYKYGRGCSMVLYEPSKLHRYSLGLHHKTIDREDTPIPFDRCLSTLSDDNSSCSSISNFADNEDYHQNTLDESIEELEGDQSQVYTDYGNNTDNQGNHSEQEEEEEELYAHHKPENNDRNDDQSQKVPESEMDVCLEQVNWAPHVSDTLKHAIRSSFSSPSTFNSNPSNSKDFSITSLTGIKNIYIITFLSFMFVFRNIANIPLTGFSWRTPEFLGARPLYTLTTCGAHLHQRLIEISMWPHHWVRVYREQGHRQREYIEFYDSVFRIMIDIGLGIAGGLLLMHFSDDILTSFIYCADRFMVDVLRSHIIWLMGWPAGLKLNDELDHVLGSFSLIGIDWWTEVVRFLSPLQGGFMNVVCISGVFGLSFMLAMLSDLLALLTSHLFLFYLLSARIYSSMLRAVYSLWNLFRGKKLNVLRQRVDSANYSVDQLLLGTVVFTIFVFLFPTVAIYYISFAFVRLFIVAIQVIINTIISILNFTPFFGIIKYCADPLSMPGGIYLEFKQLSSQKQYETETETETETKHNNIIILVKRVFRHFCLCISKNYNLSHLAIQRWIGYSPLKSSSEGHILDTTPRTVFADINDKDISDEVQSGVIRRRQGRLERIRSTNIIQHNHQDTTVHKRNHSATDVVPNNHWNYNRGVKTSGSPPHKNCAYFLLKSQPIAFSSLFTKFYKICSILRRHYTFSLITRCALLGYPVPQAPPLQREILHSPSYLPTPSQIRQLIQTFYATAQLQCPWHNINENLTYTVNKNHNKT